LQFLVATALVDGDLTQRQYEEERWLDDDVKALMARTTVDADPSLTDAAHRAFPATVEVRLAGGRVLSQTVLRTPGSPESPWSWPEVSRKFARLDRAGVGSERIAAIADAVRSLNNEAAVTALVRELR
jgi:2-methylcitrate dehydratase PrpD